MVVRFRLETQNFNFGCLTHAHSEGFSHCADASRRIVHSATQYAPVPLYSVLNCQQCDCTMYICLVLPAVGPYAQTDFSLLDCMSHRFAAACWPFVRLFHSSAARSLARLLRPNSRHTHS